MDNILIRIELRDGSQVTSTVFFSVAPPWRLRFDLGPDGYEVEYEGSDLFDCLVKARREWEKKGARILCNGSRRDVYPSGMSRQMSGGRKAYVLGIGERASSSCLVDIFEPAAPDMVATVDDQKVYYEQWIRSIMP